MSLRTRLIDLLYRAATGTRRFRTLATFPGALVFFTLITLMILLFLRIDRWWHLPALPGRPWNLMVSLPLLVGGGGSGGLVDSAIRPGEGNSRALESSAQGGFDGSVRLCP